MTSEIQTQGANASTPSAERICQLLAHRRYNIQDEKSLQDGLQEVLTSAHVAFSREHVLDARNRPDFMLGTLAVEVKTKGSFAQFMRQAQRYLERDDVTALIAIGTPKWLSQVPGSLLGKPVYSVRLVHSLL